MRDWIERTYGHPESPLPYLAKVFQLPFQPVLSWGPHTLRVVGWSDVVEASLPRQLAAATLNWPTPARGRVLNSISNNDTVSNLAGTTCGKH